MNFLQGLTDKFIEVNGNKITFTVQDGLVPDVGKNGLQASDLIIALKQIFESLDNQFPCEENRKTIDALGEAYYWQIQRTIDRRNRDVEGKNEL